MQLSASSSICDTPPDAHKKPMESVIRLVIDGPGFKIVSLSKNRQLNKRVKAGNMKGLMAVDTHVHCMHADGIYSPHQMVDMAVANGVQVLCITDHNNTEAARQARQYAKEFYPDQIQIILGCELSTNEGHLLVNCGDDNVADLLLQEFPFVKDTDDALASGAKADYIKYNEHLHEHGKPVDSIKETLKKISFLRVRLLRDFIDKFNDQEKHQILNIKLPGETILFTLEEQLDYWTNHPVNINQYLPTIVAKMEKVLKRSLRDDELNSFSLFTTLPHPKAGHEMIDRTMRKRGLAHMGGVGVAVDGDKLLREVLKSGLLDAIEGLNGATLESENEQAAALVKELGIVARTGGSDWHYGNAPNTLMLMRKSTNLFDMFQDIIAGQSVLVKRDPNLSDTLGSTVFLVSWAFDYWLEEQKRTGKHDPSKKYKELITDFFASSTFKMLQPSVLKFRRLLYGLLNSGGCGNMNYIEEAKRIRAEIEEILLNKDTNITRLSVLTDDDLKGVAKEWFANNNVSGPNEEDGLAA